MVGIMRKANHFWQSASKSTPKINKQSDYIWVSGVTLILYFSWIVIFYDAHSVSELEVIFGGFGSIVLKSVSGVTYMVL